MTILALDQASRVSGYSIFSDGLLVSYGTFKTTDEDIADRLLKIKNKILDLIKEYNVDEVYYEDIQLHKSIMNNVATFKTLAEVVGVVELTCKEINMPCYPVRATTWKSHIGIPTQEKRPAQKKMTQNYVLENYKLKASEDACDAIGIGTYIISTKGYSINKLSAEGKKNKEESGFDWS